MDFYESDENYCSHANDNHPVSYQAGLKIPFVVYTTARYRETNPVVMRQLKEQATKTYNIENLPDLILLLTGYKVKH